MQTQIAETKLAVLCGSIVSALVGAVVLLWPKRQAATS